MKKDGMKKEKSFEFSGSRLVDKLSDLTDKESPGAYSGRSEVRDVKLFWCLITYIRRILRYVPVLFSFPFSIVLIPAYFQYSCTYKRKNDDSLPPNIMTPELGSFVSERHGSCCLFLKQEWRRLVLAFGTMITNGFFTFFSYVHLPGYIWVLSLTYAVFYTSVLCAGTLSQTSKILARKYMAMYFSVYADFSLDTIDGKTVNWMLPLFSISMSITIYGFVTILSQNQGFFSSVAQLMTFGKLIQGLASQLCKTFAITDAKFSREVLPDPYDFATIINAHKLAITSPRSVAHGSTLASNASNTNGKTAGSPPPLQNTKMLLSNIKKRSPENKQKGVKRCDTSDLRATKQNLSEYGGSEDLDLPHVQ